MVSCVREKCIYQWKTLQNLSLIHILMEVNKMLCQFTVKNFKSIRDEVTFDMQAAAISEHENRIIKDVDEEMCIRDRCNSIQ